MYKNVLKSMVCKDPPKQGNRTLYINSTSIKNKNKTKTQLSINSKMDIQYTYTMK